MIEPVNLREALIICDTKATKIKSMDLTVCFLGDLYCCFM